MTSISVLAYTITTMIFAKPGNKFFDSDWIQHGFCVIQKDVPYWNSHDLCLYFDIVLVCFGLLIYKSLKGMPVPAMKSLDEVTLFSLLGHLGHGIIHGFIARNYREGGGEGAQHISSIEKLLQSDDEENMKMKIMKHMAVNLGFWFALLKGILPNLALRKLSITAIVAVIGGLFVKDVLGFAYVQAVITIAFTSTQLVLPREKKEFSYATSAAGPFVLSVIPWIESTACQSIAAKMGGHLIYDVAIPVVIMVSYCASWHHYSGKKMKEKAF
eukprot:CAMPEP_0204621600 /NCGR_PEP_ID=MMETSP0717-20131115/7253_1 /ASSEMBLY_ACC=CAM_ASM_000666 /TAXON_ID=230516 /ORGANISM="Chaetoceros curvisetus" /LENGTH=270 /DNA_ID=CAMNT_0051636043 /DNA_START=104 /DNA_END=916 /DNA_ORIENTATION=+